MNLEDPPSPEDWQVRLDWFNAAEAQALQQGTDFVSEQAAALVMELRRSFCAGAWAACVILAAAVLEAHQREAKTAGFRYHKTSDDAWLKDWRNRLLHAKPDEPALTVEGLWLDQGDWEGRAKRAIQAALDGLGRQAGEGA